MLIQQKLGNIESYAIHHRSVDTLFLEWHETNKRILHKTTVAGTGITLKFLKEDPAFSQGDVLFASGDTIVVIDITPCDAIVVRPPTMYRMAFLCYEIGNKHLPLFMDGEHILVPFEIPLFKWLAASGFEPLREQRKLLNPIKTTTLAHAHSSNDGSLFSRILQLTKSPSNE